MVSSVVPHFKNWHTFVDTFECVPGFSNSLQIPGQDFPQSAHGPGFHFSSLNLTVPAPVPLQGHWSPVPPSPACPWALLSPGAIAVGLSQPPGCPASCWWGGMGAGGKMLQWQTCCGLLCRVCVSYLMCLMTRPNFCESAQELFMANDILAILYYFVCAFVCACV